MDCSEIRENLSAFQDRELDPAASEAVSAHLALCPECARILAGYEAVLDAMGDAPAAPPAPGLASKVMESVAAESAAARPARGRWVRVAAAAAAVALVSAGLFFAMSGRYAGPGSDSPGSATPASVSFDDVVAEIEKDPALLEILGNLEELEMIEVLENLPILERMEELKSPEADELAAARGASLVYELPLEERD